MVLLRYITQVQLDFGALFGVRPECERAAIGRRLNRIDHGIVAADLLQRLRWRSAGCR